MNILFFIVVILFIITFIFAVRTYQVQTSPEQKEFLRGKVPSPAPKGLYDGSVKNLKTSWLGKSFMPEHTRGINLFKEKEKEVEKYPFATYTGKGIQDKRKDVFKIDYNIAGNPLWLRFILDEIVEIAPDTFLGKVHIRFFPGAAYTLGYFMLEK